MKLALVYPPFFAKAFNENLPTVDDEFGLFPHLGFGWVARAAREAGWDVRLWDAAATKMPLDRVVAEVEAFSPDAVGFSAHAAQTIRDMLSWSKTFKERTGLPAIVGGYEAKAYPEEILSHGCFDYLCAGDSHVALPPLLRAIERGHGYDEVPDLFYREHGRMRPTFRGPRPPFREFPTPDRTVFPNHLYYSHVSQRRSFTIGMSEVGCPYPCSFCCMRLSGWQPRSAEQIVAEMEECLALGIREVDWFDPLMLHDRERALAIAREVKRRKLDVLWSCRSRVDSLSFQSTRRGPDEELIEALAEGGCRRIFFGVESGDDEVLKQMMKGQTTTASMRTTLEAVDRAGIMSLGFFILGAPGDDRVSVKRTVDLAKSLPLSYAQFQIAIIKPHTELEKQHVIDGTGIDYWREYVRGTIEEHLLPTPWTELERAELERLARDAYFKFYGRPGYALKMLLRIESREELVRYLRVGTQMLLRPLRPENRVGLGRRALRSLLTAAEALLTVANPGARHPVFKEGGGLRGALALARDRFDERSPHPVLTPERAQELLALIPGARERARTAPIAKNRYVPFFDELTERDRPNAVREPPRRRLPLASALADAVEAES